MEIRASNKRCTTRPD